jgi:hypothetical protein
MVGGQAGRIDGRKAGWGEGPKKNSYEGEEISIYL